MASLVSSSSPSSETAGKPNPYQIDEAHGSPKGAFEARKVRAGLYVRVDMPGVPNDAVKVKKYDETRTVTFSGKAPSPTHWTGFDSPDHVRVYGGYVVIDRHLADVKFVYHLKNGCLRLFFPGCDGTLHFLSPPRTGSSSSSSGPVRPDASLEPGQDEEEEKDGDGDDVEVEPYTAFISHDPQNPQDIILGGGSPDHINPYLLSGSKGVYEHKTVTLDNGDQLIYIRLDVPDTCEKSTAVIENYDYTHSIMLAALAIKTEYYSRFDEATRQYNAILVSTCQCCSYSVVKSENVSGVLRVLVRKNGNGDAGNSSSTPPTPVMNYQAPRSIRGLYQPLLSFMGAGSATMRFHSSNERKGRNPPT